MQLCPLCKYLNGKADHFKKCTKSSMHALLVNFTFFISCWPGLPGLHCDTDMNFIVFVGENGQADRDLSQLLIPW